MRLTLYAKRMWRYFQPMALHPVLDFPRFATDDVLTVTGLSAGELKGLLDRRQFNLALGQNPGSGRSRQFAGRDVLKLSVRRAMAPLGLPLTQVQRVADLVEERAATRFQNQDTEHLRFAIYPISEGNWHIITIWSDISAYKLPLAVQLLDVDGLIDETLARLQAVIDGRPLPSRDVATKEAYASPQSPDNDFYKRWMRDEKGRQCLVGLDFAETHELKEIRERIWANARDPGCYPWTDDRTEEGDLQREHELEAKHEAVRRRRFDAHLDKVEMGEIDD